MEELMPCPFCGGKAEFAEVKRGRDSGGRYVSCTKCDGGTTRLWFELKDSAAREMAEAWNRRVCCRPGQPETRAHCEACSGSVLELVPMSNRTDVLTEKQRPCPGLPPQPDVQVEREAYREFFMQLAGLMDACGRHRLHMDGIFKKWDRIRRGDFAPAQKEGEDG